LAKDLIEKIFTPYLVNSAALNAATALTVNMQSVALVEITATQGRKPDVDYKSANTSMNSSSSS
jgi:hypothetical protein